MKKSFYVIVLSLFILQACGTFKHTTTMKEKTSTMAWHVLMENLRSSAFNEPYLIQKWSVDFSSPQFSGSFTVRMQMIKDSALLLSISKFGLPLAKAFITPEKAAYYENLNNTCYEGPLDELSNKLGLHIDFSQLQALITGDMAVDLNKGQWDMKVTEDQEAPYVIYARQSSPVVEMSFTSFFKIFREVLEHDGKKAIITYETYNRNGKTPLPENIKVETENAHIKINIKKSFIEQPSSFRFRLPAKCKHIRL